MSLLFSGGKLTQRILAENGIWFRNGVNTTTGLDTVKRMAGIRRSLTGTEVGTAFDGGDPGCPLKDGNAT
ncbi:hypothetical protein, partial [Candidatus Pantoea deserta]|uniref:hypothetical protein n=1 Tax=Candidatus Pantoea deserta TaxID=1869313 RepID=UPI0034E23BCF